MPIAVTTGTGADGIAAPGSSGIKVLVIGCGFGGIAAAIECYHKGHEVVVFEKNSEIGGLGGLLQMKMHYNVYLTGRRGYSRNLAKWHSPAL